MKSTISSPGALERDALDREAFRQEVLRGLRQPAKELPCKYFYDELGSRLFDEICELDEYYLTRTEMAIMNRHVAEMAACLGPRCLLVEFGSGSSRKTRLLLDHLLDAVAYIPIDLSASHLAQSARALAVQYPHLEILPLCADFAQDFVLPPSNRPRST